MVSSFPWVVSIFVLIRPPEGALCDLASGLQGKATHRRPGSESATQGRRQEIRTTDRGNSWPNIFAFSFGCIQYFICKFSSDRCLLRKVEHSPQLHYTSSHLYLFFNTFIHTCIGVHPCAFIFSKCALLNCIMI